MRSQTTIMALIMNIFAMAQYRPLTCSALSLDFPRHLSSRPFISFSVTPTRTRLFSSHSTPSGLDVDSLQEISSTKSKTVKLYQTLSSKSKARNQNQMTILEGHRLVIDTIYNDKTRSLYKDVLVTWDALNHPQLGEKLSSRLQMLVDEGQCNVRLAADNVMKAACDTVTPQGVVAVVDIPPPYEGQTEIERETSSKDHTFFIVFDGISDPGNVGTLLRSAFSVGADAIIALPNTCDLWSPKAIRSAMGTSFQVPVRSVQSWDECLTFMESCGVTNDKIYAATMEGSEKANGAELVYESKPHDNIHWTDHSSALILGREGTGLTSEIRKAVAEGQIRSVHVPMEPGIESLNAAVCGSVIMFEYHRQCRAFNSSEK
mmetsp:Transcript_12301/g.17953  ORF Transcript_12301/g.17953 Transcript_12301/m.17953 type:complete len:375 (-) Transcript_12301:482-1606(-)